MQLVVVKHNIQYTAAIAATHYTSLSLDIFPPHCLIMTASWTSRRTARSENYTAHLDFLIKKARVLNEMRIGLRGFETGTETWQTGPKHNKYSCFVAKENACGGRVPQNTAWCNQIPAGVLNVWHPISPTPHFQPNRKPSTRERKCCWQFDEKTKTKLSMTRNLCQQN